MDWQDEGFLLSKIKFRENANIINVFTNTHGKVSGIVYGGNSRKIRNFLQISNKIYVFYNSKGDNRIGYFKTELVEAISPKYFNSKKKTTCLLSLSSILNLLLPDSQPYKNLFFSVENFLKELNQENWVSNYVYWELNLIKELGFDPYLEQFAKNLDDTSNHKIFEIDNIRYQIPVFLLKQKNNEVIDFNRNLIYEALRARNQKNNYLAYNYTGMSIMNTKKLITNKKKFIYSLNFEMDFFPFFIKKYKTNLVKLKGFWHSIDNEKDILAVNDRKKSLKKFLILNKIKKNLLQ